MLCFPHRRSQVAGGKNGLLTAMLPRQGATSEGRDDGSEGASAAWAAELCARAPLLAQMPWHAVQPRNSVLAALAALADAAALRTGAGGAQASDATAALETLLGVSGSAQELHVQFEVSRLLVHVLLQECDRPPGPCGPQVHKRAHLIVEHVLSQRQRAMRRTRLPLRPARRWRWREAGTHTMLASCCFSRCWPSYEGPACRRAPVTAPWARTADALDAEGAQACCQCADTLLIAFRCGHKG